MEELLKLFLGEVPRTPERGEHLSDLAAMKLAIAEAWQGAGRTSPNPMVGCVILTASGQFIAKGHHAKYGEAHAEVAALANLAGVPSFSRDNNGWKLTNLPKELTGARVFVTLEPCAHEGLTPSCAKTLASLPLGEVIYGVQDPNPKVSGKGAELIRARGISCRMFKELSPLVQLNQELEDVAEHFLLNFREKRPFVTLKVASSLDGMFSLKNGDSQWITSEKSRHLGHLFRGTHDAILVGRGTVERDNPALNIRHPFFNGVRKKIVVVDSHGKLLNHPELKLFKIHKPEDLIWAVNEDYKGKPAVPVKLIRMPADDRGLDLGQLHQKIWDEGIRSVYIEAGGKTLSAHLRSGTADRLLLFQAPMILGGQNARGWSEGFGVQKLEDQLRLDRPRRISIDQDQLITGRISYDSQ